MDDQLASDLSAIVGPNNFLTSENIPIEFTQDWSKKFSGAARAVIFPSTTAQVSKILAYCNDRSLPVIAQGGNTGLVGGGVPGEVTPLPLILSLKKLSGCENFDQDNGQITVAAGTTLTSLQEFISDSTWEFGVKLAVRKLVTIGGMIATNAGGVHVLNRGMTRAQVLGLEVILADGTILSHISDLLKNNTGYDLNSIFIGSEGTLGVITRARLKLHPKPLKTAVAFIGIENIADALSILIELRTQKLLALELITKAGMELVTQKFSLDPQTEPERNFYLTIEVDTSSNAPPILFGAKWVESDAEKQRIWQYRELQPNAVAQFGIVNRFDVSAPVEKLPEFVELLETLKIRNPDITHFDYFGHLGDGNLHVVFIGDKSKLIEIENEIYGTIRDLGGSISAEHGIGRLKVDKLQYSRSKNEIKTMLAIKRALDPNWILNPGVILPIN